MNLNEKLNNASVNISVCICTYNRSKYLQKCLDALLPQIKTNNINVLIVDNNSSDGTYELVNSFQKQFSFLEYVKESKQGLSHARNTAFQRSKAVWIAYLDDDGIPHKDYINRLLYGVNNYDFDCYGGMYYAYYESKKPKWISNDFGTKRLLSLDIGYIDSNLLSGGIFNIKREVLVQVGGFKTTFGMKGSKIGYGEESELQYRVRQQGFKIGFDPFLKMDHLVASYKLKLTWQIKREFALYRDSPRIRRYDANYKSLFFSFFYCTLQRLPKLLYRFLRNKNYYIQNLIFDYLKPMIEIYGTINNPLLRK